MIAVKRVLVATDFSEASVAALTYGQALARAFGSTLHVLHVAEQVLAAFGSEAYTAVAPELQDEVDRAARARLDALLAGVGGGLEVTGALETSSAPALSIVEHARAREIDLIVMGTHGRGALAHVMVGSVAERVVRLAPCPVLTVRPVEREFVVPDPPGAPSA